MLLGCNEAECPPPLIQEIHQPNARIFQSVTAIVLTFYFTGNILLHE